MKKKTYDNGHSGGTKLLSSSAHGSSLGGCHVALEGSIRDSDDARASGGGEAQEVLEREEENIA